MLLTFHTDFINILFKHLADDVSSQLLVGIMKLIDEVIFISLWLIFEMTLRLNFSHDSIKIFLR